MSFQRIVKSSAWVSLHTGLLRLVSLLIAIMSARLLGVEDYGKVAVMQSTAAMFIMLATMGLGTVATKLVAEHDHLHLKAISVVNVGLSICAALLLFILKDWLADDIYRDTELSPLIGYTALYILFCGITQVQTGVLAGKEAYHAISSLNMRLGIVSLGVVYGAIAWLGLHGWLVAMIVIEVIRAIALHRTINQTFTHRHAATELALSAVLKPALPIALSGFFVLPVNWYLVRELLVSGGYLDVAVMNIADQWIAILTFFPIAIGNAMLPIMAKLQAKTDRHLASQSALKLNIAIGLAASVVVALAAHFVLLLYGEEYVVYSHVFWILVPLVVTLSMTNQLNNRVIADNKASAMFISNIIWMLISLPLGLLLISLNYGIVGVLLGRLCGYLAKLLYLIKASK